jgi:hypothetical protein
MRRINIFSLAVGLFAATTAFAQAPRPAGSASRVLALEQAMDKKDAKVDRRSAKPVDPPDIDINCNLPHGHNRSINAVLAKLDPHRAWTLEVSGTCNENVTIQSFENITLIANPGASINDASGGTLDVLDVFDTHEFSLQGFTINGGLAGVGCADYSLCRFSGNTIQGAAGDGLVVARSQASLQGDTLQSNAGRGLAAINSGVVLGIGITTQGNAAAGVIGNAGGHLTFLNLTSRNNGGHGIRVMNHSTLRLIDNTLIGNGGSGVRIDGSSEALFDTNTTGSVITGNGHSGVGAGDLSFALFAGTDQITGNNLFNPGGVDVFCGPQFSATRGALTNIGGGTTNCTEP